MLFRFTSYLSFGQYQKPYHLF